MSAPDDRIAMDEAPRGCLRGARSPIQAVSRESVARVLKFLLCLPALIAVLAGCDQQAMFEKFVPKEESAIAKTVLSRLAAKDYEAVENQLDPSIKNASVHGVLEQMAGMFPAGEPISVNTVGSNTSTVNGVTTYNLTFEYQFSSTWLLANVAFQRRGDQVVIFGLHVNPMQQSLRVLNEFTFAGKSILHYVVFALAIVIPLFIVATLVLCVRTAIAKRKWLWLLFIAVGFVQFSFNWTNGTYGIQPISFAILGAGFFRSGPYAPVIFDIAFPLGAIIFLFKRRSLAAPNAL